MKHSLLTLFAITVFSLAGWAQQNMLTFSGGYTFANPEDSDVTATGFRINGLYEFNPLEGKVAHGLNVAYIENGYERIGIGGTIDYKISTLAIFYAPKLMLGNSEKFKFYLKGALGWQFSNFSNEGALLEVEVKDSGFYGGAGLGGMYYLKSNVFLNLEYEWAYLSNSFYKDGFLNTVQMGIGFRF